MDAHLNLASFSTFCIYFNVDGPDSLNTVNKAVAKRVLPTVHFKFEVEQHLSSIYVFQGSDRTMT